MSVTPKDSQVRAWNIRHRPKHVVIDGLHRWNEEQMEERQRREKMTSEGRRNDLSAKARLFRMN